MVGWLDEKSWAQQYRLFEYISQQNIHASYEAMLDILMPLTVRNVTDFEVEFKCVLHDWLLAAKSPNSTMLEKSTGRFLMRASDAVRRAGLVLPWNLMRLHRTTIISDIIELKLYPQVDLVAAMETFFSEEAWRQVQASCNKQQFSSSAVAAWQAFVRGPSVYQVFSTWLETRLPAFARDYGLQFSRFERAAALVLHYLRAGTWLFVAALVFFKFFYKYQPVDSLRRTRLEAWNLDWPYPTWIFWAGGAALLAYVLGRVLKNFQDSP
jgi:predicted unusual protein kinase regulating ubiquinone biosynthesis (AarF/ABC1/UbiB family)